MSPFHKPAAPANPSPSPSFTIEMGAMAKHISLQFPKAIKEWIYTNPDPHYLLFLGSADKSADCITWLSIHGLLTDNEKEKARQRLVKKIKRFVADVQRRMP